MIFSRETSEKLTIYIDFLKKCRATINLVSNKSFSQVWDRHVLDSAQIFSFFSTSSSLLDVGTGAGFPGLVLSIMGLKNVHLVESDKKKAIFLQEAIRLTGASAVVHNCRIENFCGGLFDFIVSRAFSPLEFFLNQTTHLRNPNSELVCFKGVSFQKELDESFKKWHFQCNLYPSSTHPSGKLLILSKIKKIHAA